MNLSNEIPGAFESWWEKFGAQSYSEFTSGLSIHGAAKSLALVAFEMGFHAGAAFPVEKPAPIPGVILSEHENREDFFAPTVPETIPEFAENHSGIAAAPAGVDKSARVSCGLCQNCGLENLAEPENAPTECSGCRYVGPLAAIFSRPAK